MESAITYYSSSNHHVSCSGIEFRRQSNASSVGAAIDRRGFTETTSLSGRPSHMNGAVAENLYRRESQQNFSSQRGKRELQPEALFGVKTRHLDIPDNTSRWGDDSSNARPRAAADDDKGAKGAPSTYDDTQSESDSDKGKALAKKIRREERRLKREKEKKKKHKHHRKDHKSSGKKVHFLLIICISRRCSIHFLTLTRLLTDPDYLTNKPSEPDLLVFSEL